MTSLTSDKKQLLLTLSNSWPANYRLKIENDEIVDLACHPLVEEIASVVDGRKCCLPYFVPGKDEIAWFNTAQDADELQSTIQALRCWFLPSYGWEDDQGWIVSGDSAATGIRKQISDMSPAGYCRWRSRESDFEAIVKKLTQIRVLDKARPELPPNGPPPLVQIRQQFVAALRARDKTSAKYAIQLIEKYQLDSADNSLFMWIEYWFEFEKYDRITKHQDIPRLSQIRIPDKVKHCITQAFYYVHLDSFDWGKDGENILASYKLCVAPIIDGLVVQSSAKQGIETIRLLACYALTKQDNAIASRLASCEGMGCLKTPLEQLKLADDISLQDQFFNARTKKNWSQLQEIGLQLLDSDPDLCVRLLSLSLRFHSNDELKSRLKELGRSEVEKLIEGGENKFVEFKSTARFDLKKSEQLTNLDKSEKERFEILKSLDKERQRDILKAVAAMLNTDGGNLIIGVDDGGQGVGIHQDYIFFTNDANADPLDKYARWLEDLFIHNFDLTCMGFLEIGFYKWDDVDICHIQIEPSSKPAFVDEKFYRRMGNSSRVLKEGELLEYAKERFS
ncbi:MAG: hypothetical protein CMJ82_05260 [Planctomycetaceae bacterium]|nr:hypothetical protein [Planctomycetaceae bacterium]